MGGLEATAAIACAGAPRATSAYRHDRPPMNSGATVLAAGIDGDLSSRIRPCFRRVEHDSMADGGAQPAVASGSLSTRSPSGSGSGEQDLMAT